MTAAVLRNSPSPSYSACAEDAAGADDVRIEVRVEAGRVAEAIDDVGRLHVAAVDQVAHDLVARHGGLLGIGPGLLRVDACILRSLMRSIDSITATASSDAQQADELAGVDQAGDVAGAVDLGRPHREVDHAGRRHRVAAGVRGTRADQRRRATVRAGLVDAVHRVVRVVAGVVLGTRRDDRAVDRRRPSPARCARGCRAGTRCREWNARPSCVSVKLVPVAALVMLGIMSPGRPSLP